MNKVDEPRAYYTECSKSEREKHDRKDTHIPTFIGALFTIAKTWKQPKCPSTEEWTKKMWYI